MLSMKDEGKGLVKTYWENVRHRVSKAAPEFAKIVDGLSPNKSFPLYLAYYPYGDLKGDTISPFLPKINGGNYRLSDENIPKDVRNDLGYGSTSSPFGMLLEKQLEYFIDLKHLGITIPWQVITPGSFFPLSCILLINSNRNYSPNGILTAVSGGRSVFMLPKIGCFTNHQMLQRDYNVQSPPPKLLYDHWNIFKEIINSNTTKKKWQSCVVYFSQKWVDKIHNDKAWHPLKKLLLELGWKKYEYERNHLYYNFAYSLIQNSRNLKPNPYLADTVSHLLTIAVGAVPGYAPACDNDLLPLDALQEAFVESYGQKKYIPTIMAPTHFHLENRKAHPVYYSLQSPTTLSFSPKSRKLSSTIFEIRELKHLVDIFTNELAKEKNILSDTIICEAAKNVAFNFYHNNIDRHNLIEQSENLIHHDERFSAKHAFKSADNSIFACDSPFVRGCISIGLKK
jgi:hypothetical protein